MPLRGNNARPGPKEGYWNHKWLWKLPPREGSALLDLYLLAATGAGRRFVQLANERDACCFAGPGHASYADEVTAQARELGGSFSLYVDEGQEEHTISERARAHIVAELAASSAPRSLWLTPRSDSPRRAP
jgi:hypothetical protein